MTIFRSATSPTFFSQATWWRKSLKTDNFFAKIEVNQKISLQNGRLKGQRSAEQNRNSEAQARRNEGGNSHFCEFGGLLTFAFL